MHKPIFEDRLEMTRGGKLVRIVNARWKDKDIDCYRQYEDGKLKVRNLFYNPMAGYMVAFQDECKESWSKPMQDIWGLCMCIPTEKEKQLVISKYPNFKYVLQKCPRLNRLQIMQVLPIWKQFPQVELLLAAGFYQIAMNKRFHAMDKSRQKKIIKFLGNIAGHNLSLAEVERMMKFGLDYEQFREWSWFNQYHGIRTSWNEYLFLKNKKREYIRLYSDYKKMAKKAGHDFNDKYWYAPKNLRKQHNRVMVEVENLKSIEEKAKAEKQQKNYLKAVKKIIERRIEMNGWKVYVPEDVNDIRDQARELNQCLIRCDYIKRVIEKKCVLVFIKFKDRPVATAEILPDGSLGQFYGNEGAKNIYPSKAAKEKLEMWMAAA